MSLIIFRSLDPDAYASVLDDSWGGLQVFALARLCGAPRPFRVAKDDLGTYGVLVGRNMARLWRTPCDSEWLAEANLDGKGFFLRIVIAATTHSAQDIDSLILTTQEIDILESAMTENISNHYFEYRATPGSEEDKACIRLMFHGALQFSGCPSGVSPYNHYHVTIEGTRARMKHDVAKATVEGEFDSDSDSVSCVFCDYPAEVRRGSDGMYYMQCKSTDCAVSGPKKPSYREAVDSYMKAGYRENDAAHY